MKKNSAFDYDRPRRFKQGRFNPIRNLTPELLSQQIDRFHAGDIRDFALTMDHIERRDDVLAVVAPKRKAAVARLDWEILTIDDLEPGQEQAAEEHQAALTHFYNNLCVTNALDGDEEGGFNLLVRQMMDAIGKRYAVHEIIWTSINKPKKRMTAELRFVPLWFFENKTGRLRFLESDYAVDGIELRPAEWMVSVGRGIMEACSVAYMFKHLPLKDWLIYSQNHGRPITEGITDAQKDSEEWDNLVEAIEALDNDLRIVHSSSAEIKITQTGVQGTLPFPPLVERMDRALAAIWRGADLSTISAGQGQGQGASLQGEEADMLEGDDGIWVSEILNRKLDRWVIQYLFPPKKPGDPPVTPLAYIRLRAPTKENVELDLRVDQFLRDSGAPLSVSTTLERYQRSMPEAGEQVLQRPAAPFQTPFGQFGNVADSSALESHAREALAKATAEDLQPIRKRLERILQIQDPDILRRRLLAFLEELPGLREDINADPAAAQALEETIAAGLRNGLER